MVKVRKLSMKKFSQKPIHVVSTKTALRDVVPIDWNDEVVNRKVKVVVGIKNV